MILRRMGICSTSFALTRHTLISSLLPDGMEGGL